MAVNPRPPHLVNDGLQALSHQDREERLLNSERLVLHRIKEKIKLPVNFHQHCLVEIES